MIFTVTLNPAIDKTIVLGRLERESVNIVNYSRNDIGGKGINVSKVLKTLAVGSTATGFLGRKNAGIFIDYLNSENICSDFYIIDGETRTNIKIVETECNTFTDINERGLAAKESDIRSFMEKLLSIVKYEDIVILSGSIPIGINSDVYGKMIYRLNKKGVRTILDGYGEVLKRGIEAVPFGVKPNLNELKSIMNIDESIINSVINGGKCLVEMGVKKALISMGSRGALYVTQESCLYAHPINAVVKSTVGAGDAMTAALAYSIENNLSDIETIKLAGACAAASVITEGTQSPKYELIMELIDEIVDEHP